MLATTQRFSDQIPISQQRDETTTQCCLGHTDDHANQDSAP